MIELFIGIISGIVTSIGMGGGTILILLLTIFLNYDQQFAQNFNLLFFIPTAIISIIIYIKDNNIKLKLAFVISIFGILGSIIGAQIANYVKMQTLNKFFAIFLLIIAIHEIYSFYNKYINKKKRNNIKKARRK